MLTEWIFRKITIFKMYSLCNSTSIEFENKLVNKKNKTENKLKKNYILQEKIIHFVFRKTSTVQKKPYEIFESKRNLKNLNFQIKKKNKNLQYCIKDISIKKLKCQHNIKQTYLNKKIYFYCNFNIINYVLNNKNLQNISFEHSYLKKQIVFVIINLDKKFIIKILKKYYKMLKKKIKSNF
jgi:hypothetical protein